MKDRYGRERGEFRRGRFQDSKRTPRPSPSDAFRAFSVQVIIAVHNFFYLICVHHDLPPYARLESEHRYTFPLCSPELIQRIDTTADRRQEDAASKNGLSVVSAVKNGQASRRR